MYYEPETPEFEASTLPIATAQPIRACAYQTSLLNVKKGIRPEA